MKILYIANIRLPTEKAHGIQIMKMCEAFALAGEEVVLAVPRRFYRLDADPFNYYRAKKNFTIKMLPVIDPTVLGKWGFWVESFTFGLSSLIFLVAQKRRDTGYIYTRDPWLALLITHFRACVFLEAHVMSRHSHTELRRLSGIIAITRGLKRLYCSGEDGMPQEKILVAPDGVSPEEFSVSLPKNELREELHLPKEKRIILYSGHLYEWKGADALALASRELPDDYCTVIVGGTKSDVEKFRAKFGNAQNITIEGHKPFALIPKYLAAADVLVLPNSGKHSISEIYTSPMKLFEYMASGVPIVASDLPSIREILNENNASLVAPDSPSALARGIMDIVRDPAGASRKAAQALRDVEKYSWRRRAQSISSFIRENSQAYVSKNRQENNTRAT